MWRGGVRLGHHGDVGGGPRATAHAHAGLVERAIAEEDAALADGRRRKVEAVGAAALDVDGLHQAEQLLAARVGVVGREVAV